MRSRWLPSLTLTLMLLIFGGCPLWEPPEPQLVAPADGGTAASRNPELIIRVPDRIGTAREVVLHGRRFEQPGEDFTLVLLPDTQVYAERFPDTFLGQTQWIVDNRDALNIAAVLHLGDLVETASVTAQWEVADAAFDILDSAPELPYGLAVGNHDQTPDGNPSGTQNFDRYFPVSRYDGIVPWYGGHFGDDNDNHYVLFSGGGLDFVAVFLEYDDGADPAVLAWADGVLKRYADRRTILVTHFTMFSSLLGNLFSWQGLPTYEALKDNPNLFLMLGGHFCETGQRTDVFEGHVVHSLVSNYQCRPNGGDGWLRLLEFSPAANSIRVRTYSPTRDEFLTEPGQELTLPYVMSGDGPFDEVGRVELGIGEEEAAIVWLGLDANSSYEWYASASDGILTTSSPLWSFTTPGGQD
jgi:hypothetical protein